MQGSEYKKIRVEIPQELRDKMAYEMHRRGHIGGQDLKSYYYDIRDDHPTDILTLEMQDVVPVEEIADEWVTRLKSRYKGLLT